MKAKNTQYKPANNSRRMIAFGTALLASFYLPQALGGEDLVETPDQLQEIRQIQQSEINGELANIRDNMIDQSIDLNSAALSQDIVLKMKEIELANEEHYQQQEELKEASRLQTLPPRLYLESEETLADTHSKNY